jgi:anti-anti-sigma factor
VSTPPFALETRHDGAVSTVRVVGELDALSAPELRECLISCAHEGQDRVVVDLARLEFVDSSGIEALLVGHQRLRAQGGALVLKDPPTRLETILRITGLDRTFSVT